MRTRILKTVAIFAIVLMNVGCDQATKSMARTWLAGRGTVALIDNIVVLHYVENEGAFMSLGTRLPGPVRTVVLFAAPIVILGILTAYILLGRHFDTVALVGAACVAGGGVGNLIDRLANAGRVSDFAVVGIGALRSGIFNFADLSIMAGCLLLLIGSRKRAPQG